MVKNTNHFQGKKPLEHLIDARKKGAAVSSETHGLEIPGHYSAAIDATKDTTMLILIALTVLFARSSETFSPFPLLFIAPAFFIGWILWKGLRSALLGWARLERLHRLIAEERWEIEHHRPQEKEELRALYEAKGFSGKMLDEVVEVLMSDDDRLLRVMLEEELGVPLESYEHPLKQGLAALGAVLATCTLLLGSLALFPLIATPLLGIVLISIASATNAYLEKNRRLPAVIWNLSGLIFAAAASYFMVQIFQ